VPPLPDEHETANKQVKTYLRGPGKILRSQFSDIGLDRGRGRWLNLDAA
jgi:hypothetical protein